MQRGDHHAESSRKKMEDAWTPARRAALAKRSSERLRRLWRDPEFRVRQLKMMAELRRDPEYRAKVSAGLKRAAKSVKTGLGKVPTGGEEDSHGNT